VLSSGGVSQVRLLLNTLVSAVIMAAVIGSLSLYVVPHAVNKVEEIKLQQANRGLFELLHPGRFEQFRKDDPRIYYFESSSNSGKTINSVFVANASADADQEGAVEIIRAATAQEFVDSPTGNRYLQLNNGHQYLGNPGELNYQVTHFRTTGSLLEKSDEEEVFRKYYERQTTKALFEFKPSTSNTNYEKAQAEIQWRYSLPILVLVLTFIAVPLSHTDPRHGRYAKIFPAFIPTIFYLGLLVATKKYIQDQVIPPSIGMWWVHGLFLAAGIALLFWNNGRPLGKWGAAKIIEARNEPNNGEEANS